ncbi:hypothetical protein [Dokdonella sp.]|uniref:hypothetical protein n=1 Tax=Dokdonella sp. TaxID=2291710 RepID=UPI0025C247D2|nr:hypothetical protein [Dokdonella sp.]MBX3692755.1 hypothetical protein [Dokdonella sp.]MCW5568370.1 hypothetical protein [Dokdonella sp.]
MVASASAVDLPDGDALFLIATTPAAQHWHPLSVDPDTAVTTSIGPATTLDGDAGQFQGHYDPASSRGYYVREYYDPTSGYSYSLASINPATGAQTAVGQLVVNPGGAPSYPAGGPLAIGPAGAFFIGGQALYRVNLATAVATHVANITFSHPMRTASSFAYDAVTGAYHVIETGDAPRVYRIDVTNGSLVDLFYIGGAGSSVKSLQFDSEGNAWIIYRNEFEEPELVPRLTSFPFANISAWENRGFLTFGGDYLDLADSLLLVSGASDDSIFADGFEAQATLLTVPEVEAEQLRRK